jgi:hypothetical protein
MMEAHTPRPDKHFAYPALSLQQHCISGEESGNASSNTSRMFPGIVVKLRKNGGRPLPVRFEHCLNPQIADISKVLPSGVKHISFN